MFVRQYFLMMSAIRKFVLQEDRLVFLFCLAVITGPAISILFAYDLTQFSDCYTYLGLSNFDFDQSPVRRFRVIIPFIAAGLNYIFGGLFDKLAPTYFVGDFGLPFSYFLINTLLMSYFGLLIYRYCKAHTIEPVIALVGVLVMLSCRYTSYLAALPMVDSLFCVTVAMTLLGVKEKNTAMTIVAIFLGPFAKEAFIFVAPIIFFFSHISKLRLTVYFLLSGILVFTYRYIYELYAPATAVSGLRADLYHVYRLYKELPVLFSFYGLYKIFSNLFVWLLVPILATLLVPRYLKTLWQNRSMVILLFVVSVVIQMLLSGSMERMFYISMPVLCLLVAHSISEMKKIYMKFEK